MSETQITTDYFMPETQITTDYIMPETQIIPNLTEILEIFYKDNSILYPKPNLPIEVIETLGPAIHSLKEGIPIGMPTETVYGLAANALDEKAVDRIFQFKGRPTDNPLIVHISSLLQLKAMLDENHDENIEYSQKDIMAWIPSVYHQLIERFWPGPLTLLFKTSSKVPSNVTAGQKTVAVRFPAHCVARAIIDMCGFPLAAPSANKSGRPSPTLPSHVKADLDGLIPFIVDGGPCFCGLESTVVNGLGDYSVILRPGCISYEDLKLVPEMDGLLIYKKDFTDIKLEEAPTTPGMKYTHYKPSCDVYLFIYEQSIHLNHNIFTDLFKTETNVGLMGDMEFVEYATQELSKSKKLPIKSFVYKNNIEFAKGLFAGLRMMEILGVDLILVGGTSEDREGMAVMNRLSKAASRIIRCNEE